VRICGLGAFPGAPLVDVHSCGSVARGETTVEVAAVDKGCSVASGISDGGRSELTLYPSLAIGMVLAGDAGAPRLCDERGLRSIDPAEDAALSLPGPTLLFCCVRSRYIGDDDAYYIGAWKRCHETSKAYCC
jgi:hypothetical protein